MVIRLREWSSSKDRGAFPHPLWVPRTRWGFTYRRVLTVSWLARSFFSAAALPGICALLAPELAEAAQAAIMHRNAQSLTKPMLIAMCRHWGYRSTLWRTKGNRCALRVAEAAPVASLVVDTTEGAMRAACRDPGAASALMERLSAKAFTAAQAVGGRKVAELAQADSSAAAFYTRTFNVLGILMQTSCCRLGEFTSLASAKVAALSWRLHNGDVLDDVLDEYVFVCSVMHRHCERKQAAVRRLRMLPFLPEPTKVTLAEIAEGIDAYLELFQQLADLTAMARRESSDDQLRAVLSLVFSFVQTQLALIVLAMNKRYQCYQGLAEQHGSEPAANGLFSRFTDQICHHFKTVLALLPKVDDLHRTNPAAAGGAQQQCAQ